MRCGIDPGRYKIGLAFAENSRLLFSAIIPKAEEAKLRDALIRQNWDAVLRWGLEGSIENLRGRTLDNIYVGDGTSSSEIVKLFGAEINIEVVDEKGSTLEGRKRYWTLHPPQGFWRLIPTSLRVPPRDIDDLAAWSLIIAD